MKNNRIKIIILVLAICTFALSILSLMLPGYFDMSYEITYGFLIVIYAILGVKAVVEKQTWGIILLGLTVVMLGLYIANLLI